MSTPVALPLFTVSNHHGPDAGDPPTLNGDDPNVYHSYFENCYGEHSLFVYDRTTQQAIRWCGLSITHKSHPLVAKSQPWVKSVRRFHPRHRGIVPGCPSCFLARNPPSRAIQMTASRREGVVGGRELVFFTLQ